MDLPCRPLFTPGTLLRQSPAPASKHFCNTLFSTLRPAPENRKSARTHAACDNTRNIRPASPAPGNTICTRSRRKCLSPSAHGPHTLPQNRPPNTPPPPPHPPPPPSPLHHPHINQ